MAMKKYYVYILTNKYHGTLYTGLTNNLIRRANEHKNKIIDGFTKKYDLTKLVYGEEFLDIHEAIAAEKKIKGKSRKWKINLIESQNPCWKDLMIE